MHDERDRGQARHDPRFPGGGLRSVGCTRKVARSVAEDIHVAVGRVDRDGMAVVVLGSAEMRGLEDRGQGRVEADRRRRRCRSGRRRGVAARRVHAQVMGPPGEKDITALQVTAIEMSVLLGSIHQPGEEVRTDRTDQESIVDGSQPDCPPTMTSPEGTIAARTSSGRRLVDVGRLDRR